MSTATRRALPRVAGWVLVASAVLAVVVAGRDATAAETEQEPEVTSGSRLYALHCAECHGSDGSGGPMPLLEGEAPALLAELNPDATTALVDLVMATGRMPPAGSPYDNRERAIILDPAEQAAIVAFMREVFELPGEIPGVGEGDPAQGQVVWNSNCAHCHGATAQGGVAGAGAWTPAVTGRSPQVIAEAIRVGPFQMPEFSEEQISDEQVDDVVAFLHEVSEEEGTPIFGLVELNPVFASGFVALLALVLLLSLVWIGARPAWFPDPTPEEREPEIPAGATRRAGSESEDTQA
jgi:ubiquinol-cytochrome c reductase cytochrome c subunit